MPAATTEKPAAADGVLAKIDRATAFLAEAKSLQEVNAVIAMAEAAKIYAKRVKASQETINHAAEIKLRAERKLGELLAKTPKNPGGLPMQKRSTGSKKEPVETLAESGIDKKLSSRAQRLASVPQPEFEQSLSKARDGEISPSRIHADLAKKKKTDNRREKRMAELKDAQPAKEGDWKIIYGDCVAALAKLPAKFARLAFADPPYNIGFDYGDGADADSLDDAKYTK